MVRLYEMKRGQIVLAIVLLLFLWVSIAWVISQYKFSSELDLLVKNEQTSAQNTSNEVADSINRNLHYIAGIPDIFEHSNRLWNALNQFGPTPQPTSLPPKEAATRWNKDPNLSELSQYSDLIRSLLHVDLIFTVNAAGDCVSSSNWNKPDNLMGMNYSDRKWFIEASKGKNSVQYAVGRVTHIAGIFFATPMIQNGQFHGVVIAKVNLSNLAFLTQQTNSYVVDNNGVVILAHKPEMEMMSIEGATVNSMTDKAKNELYLRTDFPELKIKPWNRHEILKRVQYDASPNILASADLKEYGLKIFSVSNLPTFTALEHECFSNFMLLSLFGGALILISYAFLSVRHAHNALKESEVRVRLILESANCGIWGQTTEGICTFINAQAAKMLGYVPNELVGKSLQATIYHTDPEESDNVWEECPLLATGRNGQSCQVDNEVFWRKDETSFLVEYATSAIYTGDSLDGSVVVFNDISERKRQEYLLKSAIEKAESANRAKSAFLANMSHEIRTPMNAVIGFTDLTIESTDRIEQQGYLQQIKDASKTLLGILNDILDLSKIESGQMTFEDSVFDVDAILNSLNRMFSLRAHEKSLEFTLIRDDGVPSLLIGDPLRIRQILTNLLGNALKFTSHGKVSLELRQTKISDLAILIDFRVQDTGIGMTPDQTANLFQAFMQADNTISRRFGGTGLGLNISRNLAKLMGGDIVVESTPGQGSVFCFQITLRVPNPTKIAEYKQEHANEIAQTKPLSDIHDLHGKRVLLVEDNRVNQMLAGHILKKLGVIVEIANNGEESLQRLNNESYDIVLMDIQMPVMNGLEATRRIRQDPRFASLPIVAMSAGVTMEEQSACNEVGMTDFVGKPINSAELARKLVELCFPHLGEGI